MRLLEESLPQQETAGTDRNECVVELGNPLLVVAFVVTSYTPLTLV
jgi:hypothetical protein